MGYGVAMRWLAVLGILVLSFAAPARAAPPVSFALPVDCEPGKTCWVAKYVDLDPSAEFKDYTCGTTLGNDGHKGTDFAVRDLEVMARGVAVLAAAPGVVVGMRDGMADRNVHKHGGAKALDGKNCGNGFRVDHGRGWFSQYCHLRKGSVSVRKGDRIVTGQKVGLVGMSGEAEFPHLHFQVTLEAKTPEGKKKSLVIDPFVGIAGRSGDTCSLGKESLWTAKALAKLTYRPTQIYNAGFAYRAPKKEEVRAGRFRATEMSVMSKALVLWTDIYGVRAGDIMQLKITGPDGKAVHVDKRTAEKDSNRLFRYAGKKRRGDPWPAGEYTGEILVLHPTGDKKGVGFRSVRKVTLK